MLRLLGVLVVLAAVVLAFGFYRGWFREKSIGGAGQSSLTVTVDKNKIDQDKAGAQNDVQNAVHN